MHTHSTKKNKLHRLVSNAPVEGCLTLEFWKAVKFWKPELWRYRL